MGQQILAGAISRTDDLLGRYLWYGYGPWRTGGVRCPNRSERTDDFRGAEPAADW
jgi:hypothetical protein